MQQVKIFKSLESEVTELEQQVNRWIRKSGARIISITGNIAPQSQASDNKIGALSSSPFAASDVLLVILYEAPDAA